MLSALRRAVPGDLRRSLRRAYDSFYCERIPGKETLGMAAPWTVCTSGLNEKSVVYSGGVGETIDFELELISRYGLSVVLFDPSAVGIKTIAQYSHLREMNHIDFLPLALSDHSGDIECGFGGQDDKTDSIRAGSGKRIACTTVTEQMKAHGHDHIDLLKIDIEGFEYEVLQHCLDEHLAIGQICVEFHHFFPDIPRSRTVAMCASLKRAGFRLFHKQMCEYSFVHVPKTRPT